MRLNFKLNKSKSTDGKGLQQHLKGLQIASSGVYVGIQENAQNYQDTTSVIMVAMINEFGSASSGIPPRHFLSRSVEIDKNFYQGRIKWILKKYDKGDAKFIDMSFRELGRQSVEKIQGHIFNNDIGMTANKPSTAKRKGGDQPAVDTKHLLDQIDYELIGGSK